jgi:hypothetical protein
MTGIDGCEREGERFSGRGGNWRHEPSRKGIKGWAHMVPEAEKKREERGR